MEQEIFFIGARKLHSTKKNKDFYIVDYVDKNGIPQSDFIEIEEFNRISKKAKPYQKNKGIFEINEYKKIYLSDIKL